MAGGYIKKTIELQDGQLMWITKVKAPMLGNHKSRAKSLKETSAAVKRINENHAIERCRAKIIENFQPGDWHICLTYDDAHHPSDAETAKANLKKFIERLRAYCKKNNIDLKYLKMSELGCKSQRWHHHIVLPHTIPKPEIERLWTCGQARTLSTINKDMDVEALARYFVDKTKQGKREDDREKYVPRYAFSRNCKEPTVKYEHVNAWGFNQKPRLPKGYELVPDTLKNAITTSGYIYQRYEIRKIPKKGKKNCRRNN